MEYCSVCGRVISGSEYDKSVDGNATYSHISFCVCDYCAHHEVKKPMALHILGRGYRVSMKDVERGKV